MKMHNLLGLVLFTVLGCDPGTTNSSPREPRSPSHEMRLLPNHQMDDTIFIVDSGWHPGKEFPITQSLHANPVVKEKLNVNLSTQSDRPNN